MKLLYTILLATGFVILMLGNYIAMGTFLDLGKSFDTVNHGVLLRKVLSFEICENTLTGLAHILETELNV